MRTVWKFPLELVDEQRVKVPVGTEPLTVQVQHGMPCLWALVGTNNPMNAEVVVHIVGTGDQAPPNNFKYLSTFQMHGGDLVFHVFVNY